VEGASVLHSFGDGFPSGWTLSKDSLMGRNGVFFPSKKAGFSLGGIDALTGFRNGFSTWVILAGFFLLKESFWTVTTASLIRALI